MALTNCDDSSLRRRICTKPIKRNLAALSVNATCVTGQTAARLRRDAGTVFSSALRMAKIFEFTKSIKCEKYIDYINMLNVHHIELFYYVAKHEGIVAACRQMPYGIQQPAVSAQVASLEKQLGVRLFERSLFRLTPAGKALYEFAAPFSAVWVRWRNLVQGRMAWLVRLAGLTEVMREHVPVLLARL